MIENCGSISLARVTRKLVGFSLLFFLIQNLYLSWEVVGLRQFTKFSPAIVVQIIMLYKFNYILTLTIVNINTDSRSRF